MSVERVKKKKGGDANVLVMVPKEAKRRPRGPELMAAILTAASIRPRVLWMLSSIEEICAINEYLASVLMHISDIDDVKNGLLLFQPLKHAFDHFQLSFLLDDTDILRLKLFDPTIRDIHLIDLKGPNGNKVLRAEQMKVLLNSTRKRCHFDTQTTYSDVDGSALTFTGLERPFDHCLFLQARLARDLAVEKHWIDAWYNVSPISVGYVS